MHLLIRLLQQVPFPPPQWKLGNATRCEGQYQNTLRILPWTLVSSPTGRTTNQQSHTLIFFNMAVL